MRRVLLNNRQALNLITNEQKLMHSHYFVCTGRRKRSKIQSKPASSSRSAAPRVTVSSHPTKAAKIFLCIFPSKQVEYNRRALFHSSFVIYSSIEGEFVPMTGDEVKYRLCIIPPKCEKYQAVCVQISHFCEVKHKRWEDSADK